MRITGGTLCGREGLLGSTAAAGRRISVMTVSSDTVGLTGAAWAVTIASRSASAVGEWSSGFFASALARIAS